jgi:nucleoside-triphosphatase THEP1
VVFKKWIDKRVNERMDRDIRELINSILDSHTAKITAMVNRHHDEYTARVKKEDAEREASIERQNRHADQVERFLKMIAEKK